MSPGSGPQAYRLRSTKSPEGRWDGKYEDMEMVLGKLSPQQVESAAQAYSAGAKLTRDSFEAILSAGSKISDAWKGEPSVAFQKELHKLYLTAVELSSSLSAVGNNLFHNHAETLKSASAGKPQHQDHNMWTDDWGDWGEGGLFGTGLFSDHEAHFNRDKNDKPAQEYMNIGGKAPSGKVSLGDATIFAHNTTPQTMSTDTPDPRSMVFTTTDNPNVNGPGGGGGLPGGGGGLPGGGGGLHPPGGGLNPPGGGANPPGGGVHPPGGGVNPPGGGVNPPGGGVNPPGGGVNPPGGGVNPPGGAHMPGTDLSTAPPPPGLGGGGLPGGGGGGGGLPGGLGGGGLPGGLPGGGVPGGLAGGLGGVAGGLPGSGLPGAGGLGGGGAAGFGGGVGMPMGAGGHGGGQGEERERSTWLVEDEDVWGGDGEAAPPVIG